MDIFFELHSGLPREGPGDADFTGQAFAYLDQLPPAPRILDVACGPGGQTLALARLTAGHITAMDLHAPFLAALRQRAGQSRQIASVQMSMFQLGFAPETFDVIWSEGAIYIIGFEAGLRAWQPWLKPGGYLAVSEISWLRPDPPEEIRAFWQADYPAMSDLAGNVQALERQGYQPLAQIVLPAAGWWPEYYTPLEERIRRLREKYAGQPDQQRQLDDNQREIDLFRRYAEWYSYIFYVARKPSNA